MQLGMIGLGRMGANMVRRLLKNGQECVVFDRSPNAVHELVKQKATGATSLADLVTKLDRPRAILSISARWETKGVLVTGALGAITWPHHRRGCGARCGR